MTGPNLIVGAGTPESTWRSWPGLADIAELPLDRWLRADQRLVIVAPHPDDELLVGGALACLHAQRGGRVLIVAVTDGEASHPGSAEWPPDRLAAERRGESTEGLRLLLSVGHEVIRLGLPDSAVAKQRPRLRAELSRVLHRSDQVLVTWRQDGHPDHDACGEVAADACAAAGCGLIEAPVWMWHWAHPGDPRIPWDRLRGLGISTDVSTRRRCALAAHRTQLSRRSSGEGPVLTDAIVARLERRTDYFFI